jgi:hypothetical protein
MIRETRMADGLAKARMLLV